MIMPLISRIPPNLSTANTKPRRFPRAPALLAVVMTASLQTGCGFSSAPECDDADVQDLMRQLHMKSNMGAIYPLAVQAEPDEFKDVGYFLAIDYDRLQAEAEINPAVKRALAAMQRQFDKLDFTYDGFRTNHVDGQTRKVWCGVQVSMNVQGISKAVQQEYTVQYTSAGDTYWELQN